MAKAFKCDRCGDFDEDDPIAGITFSRPDPAAAKGSSARKQQEYELCTRCLVALNDWIEAPRQYHP